MSFGFLPWKLYVLLTIACGITIFIYYFRQIRNFPKIYILGWFLISLCSIIAGFIKYLTNMNILVEYIEYLNKSVITLILPTIALIMTGAYIKVKDDTEKRRLILICILGIFVTLLFMGLIVLSIIY